MLTTKWSRVLLGLGIACAACGEREDSAPQRLKIGIIPITEVAPLYIGIAKGYFEQEGIDLELVRMAGGAEILPAVGNGSVDIGFSNIVSLVVFHANRSTGYVALIGGTYETTRNVNHALVAKPGANQNLNIWNGAVVGINTRNNIEELMLLRYLRSQGIDRNAVTLRAIPFPAMQAGVARGDLTVASLVEPFITKARGDGFVILGNQYLTGQNDTVMVATYVATTEWIDNNADLARRFQRAFRRATDFLNQGRNEQEIRSILAEQTALPQEQADVIGLPLMRECIDVNGLEAIARDLPEFGFVDRVPPVDSLIAPTAPRC